jgi:hypothetical protein
MNNIKYNLLYSSSLFIIPTVYGYYNKKYALSTMSLISMLASMNYWRKPISGTRQNADIVISKVAGAVYFFYGVNNVHGTIFRIFGFTNGFLMLSFYNCSCILHSLKSNSWEYFHMMFHISIILCKMIILSS